MQHLPARLQTVDPGACGADSSVSPPFPSGLLVKPGQHQACWDLARAAETADASTHVAVAKKPDDAWVFILVGLPRFELGTSTMSR